MKTSKEHAALRLSREQAPDTLTDWPGRMATKHRQRRLSVLPDKSRVETGMVRSEEIDGEGTLRFLIAKS